jgi:nucleoside-diphosphate-sugar epimerase
VGTSALDELRKTGHQVRCFDLKTQVNEKIARRYKDDIEVIWGDLRRAEDVAAAVQDQDIVIHLAFVIPKMSHTGVESESHPDWAREINVGGTRTLIEAIQAMPRPARLIFSSSVHVFGPPQESRPPRTASDPVHPTEHYSRHKIECEQMIRASGLEWSILRFAAALPISIRLDPGMFDVPLENRMEYVHTRDVGAALAHAVESEEIWGKLLLIGGGPRCQYRFREIVGMILTEMGVGMLPERAFGLKPFATDWMDTSESQQLLNYQRRDLRDYVKEMKQKLGFRLALIWMFRPLVRAWLLRKSPYYATG